MRIVNSLFNRASWKTFSLIRLIDAHNFTQFLEFSFYRIQDQLHTNQDCMQNQLVLDLLFQMFLHRNSKLQFQLP